ncbi:hypothetical protein B0H10DRAFT_2428046 [Mycena sp. CBHHK59/15]|nr:hypothetical protein B0H10DRAFT_2428046 [Mycena sp. CBHHK59/15]
MSLDVTDAEPRLPTELEREVFETTALMYPREIPTLLRVARRVLVWIEPVLYRVVRVNMDNDALMDGVLDAIKSKPADFFHKAVRHLCLDSYVTEDVGLPILEVCTGVVDLALNQQLASPTLLPVLAKMSLRRLSTSLHSLFDGEIDILHPLFTFLTHLDLLDCTNHDVTETLAQIPSFAALTHLALDWVRMDMAETLLENCPRLELLLCLYDELDYKDAQTPHVYDIRFVIGQYDRDYRADWEAGAKGLPHLWSLGDDFVARKRRGAIEATCYWIQ